MMFKNCPPLYALVFNGEEDKGLGPIINYPKLKRRKRKKEENKLPIGMN